MCCTDLNSGCGHLALYHEGLPTAVFHLWGRFLPPMLPLEDDRLRCVQSYRNRTFSLVFSLCPEVVGIVTDLLIAKNIWKWKKKTNKTYFGMFLSGSPISQALWGLDSLSGVRRWWHTECHSCLPSGSALLCLWLKHIHTAKSLHSDLSWLVIHGLWPLPASGKCEKLWASPVPLISRPGEPAHCGRWCVCLQIYNLMGVRDKIIVWSVLVFWVIFFLNLLVEVPAYGVSDGKPSQFLLFSCCFFPLTFSSILI